MVRLPACTKAAPQPSKLHAYGFSPVWVRLCATRWLENVNAASQPSKLHTKGRSPVCTRRCLARSFKCGKAASQPSKPHVKGRSPVCVRRCTTRLLDSISFLHSSHATRRLFLGRSPTGSGGGGTSMSGGGGGAGASAICGGPWCFASEPAGDSLGRVVARSCRCTRGSLVSAAFFPASRVRGICTRVCVRAPRHLRIAQGGQLCRAVHAGFLITWAGCQGPLQDPKISVPHKRTPVVQRVWIFLSTGRDFLSNSHSCRSRARSRGTQASSLSTRNVPRRCTRFRSLKFALMSSLAGNAHVCCARSASSPSSSQSSQSSPSPGLTRSRFQ